MQNIGLFIAALFMCFQTLQAQEINKTVSGKIGTPMLTVYGNQQSLPVYVLGSNTRLLLSFDDLEGGVKSYYYSFQLCDYNWRPANLSVMDYVRGFVQNRISNYRYSSVALTNYTHYEAMLPDNNSMPTRSGNYILKVFLNGDTSNLVFTKRLLVVEPMLSINAQVVQPFTPEFFKTHQRLKFNATGRDMNVFSSSHQIKAVVLQNNRWDIAETNIPPTFIRGNSMEFNTENVAIFPAGYEWRWLDLRSIRLQSDRIRDGVYGKTSTDLYVHTDRDRANLRYAYFHDLNGMFQIETRENINPNWQGDYANVHFFFKPEDNLPFAGKKLFLIGSFNNYGNDENGEMKFDNETQLYYTSAFLKQGYYNYGYALKDADGKIKMLEGDYWETENLYTVLIYYKSFSDRNDRLIGITQVNSRVDRPGIAF